MSRGSSSRAAPDAPAPDVAPALETPDVSVAAGALLISAGYRKDEELLLMPELLPELLLELLPDDEP